MLLALEPGQIVDKYGFASGKYLAPEGTTFEERSLPYDRSRIPLQVFRVKKRLLVHRGRTAAWFGEPGGGVQFRTDVDIRVLDGEYLENLGERK